jgi:hypothetical protein
MLSHSESLILMCLNFQFLHPKELVRCTPYHMVDALKLLVTQSE